MDFFLSCDIKQRWALHYNTLLLGYISRMPLRLSPTIPWIHSKTFDQFCINSHESKATKTPLLPLSEHVKYVCLFCEAMYRPLRAGCFLKLHYIMLCCLHYREIAHINRRLNLTQVQHLTLRHHIVCGCRGLGAPVDQRRAFTQLKLQLCFYRSHPPGNALYYIIPLARSELYL